MLASICTTVVTHDCAVQCTPAFEDTWWLAQCQLLSSVAMSVTFVGSERVWQRLRGVKTTQRQKMLLQDFTNRRKALKLQERELHKRQQQLIKREKDILSVGLILFSLGNASLQILTDYLEKKTGWAAAHISGNHGAQHWGTLSGS